MSCVTGLVTTKGHVILGADSSASDGNVLIPNLFDKVILKRIGIDSADKYIDIAIGTCGPTQVGTAIRNFLELPLLGCDECIWTYVETNFLAALREAIEKTGYDYFNPDTGGAGEFLIGVQGRIYFVDHTFGIVSSNRGYDAIGSAREVALGSLHATRLGPSLWSDRERVDMALSAASDLTVHVAGPFMFVEAKYGVKRS